MRNDLIARLGEQAERLERAVTDFAYTGAHSVITDTLAVLNEAAVALSAQGETARQVVTNDAGTWCPLCRRDERAEPCTCGLARATIAHAIGNDGQPIHHKGHHFQGAIVDSRLAYPKEGAIAAALNAINAAIILTHADRAAASPLPPGEGLEQAVEDVVTTFKRDEAQGYRSRDREFAIEILDAALTRARAQGQP